MHIGMHMNIEHKFQMKTSVGQNYKATNVHMEMQLAITIYKNTKHIQKHMKPIHNKNCNKFARNHTTYLIQNTNYTESSSRHTQGPCDIQKLEGTKKRTHPSCSCLGAFCVCLKPNFVEVVFRSWYFV